MKYVDEFRAPPLIKKWVASLSKRVQEDWTLMEICGGQTHNIIKYGIDSLLPDKVHLIHGPGCPVCVTPLAMIDAAIALARKPKTILCSFGDMLRVPGSSASLLSARAQGADVRIVYSPREALLTALREPEREVIFFAVGFETTAPANAAIVVEASRRGVRNFSLLVSHVLVPPAIKAILAEDGCLVQGFLAAGHVCTITGYEDYYSLAAKYRAPIVITGFEPLDILQGVYLCIDMLESKRVDVVNQYLRSVTVSGNAVARMMMDEVYEVCDREWRGIGLIPKSGYRLRSHLAHFDALAKYPHLASLGREDPACQAGAILQGKLKPPDCPAFGKRCYPKNPLGAPMVSNEGACAAYYLYKSKGESYA